MAGLRRRVDRPPRSVDEAEDRRDIDHRRRFLLLQVIDQGRSQPDRPQQVRRQGRDGHRIVNRAGHVVDVHDARVVDQKFSLGNLAIKSFRDRRDILCIGDVEFRLIPCPDWPDGVPRGAPCGGRR